MDGVGARSGRRVVIRAIERHQGNALDRFRAEVNDVLAEHLISFRLVGTRMVPFESRELFTEVVRPALQLLAFEQWADVELAYQNALKETGVDPADAITDATTALQLTLKRLGCDGNRLAPLAKSAVSAGYLASKDLNLYNWIAAERSAGGDSHGAGAQARRDAWRVIHIVGAEILYLVEQAETLPAEER